MKKTTWSGAGVPNIDPAKEKRKLILLTVATLMVGGAFLYSNYQSSERADANRDLAPRDEVDEVVTIVELPEINAGNWRAAVRDETRLERLELRRENLEPALDVARRMVPAHYAELGLRDMDADVVASLLEAPDAERGQAFRARGWVEEFSARQAPGNRTEYQGLLLLEDGAPVYFVTLRARKGLSIGDFAVLDGLFLQRFTDETDDGWLDGPLLVGGELRRSYPRLEGVDWDRVEVALTFVQDDSATAGTGRPFEATWTLMAYAADTERVAADIEWSKAPELQQGLMKELLRNPSAYRGQAFRIPISQVMGMTVLDPGENPLRAERVTDGWLGNTSWTDVVQFTAPFASDIAWRPETQGRTLAWARGFFIKPVNYEPRTGGLRQAPFFVLTELVEHHPPPDRTWTILATIAGGLFVTFTAFLGLAWVRDKRKSRQLQQNLTRRREERRSRTASASTS